VCHTNTAIRRPKRGERFFFYFPAIAKIRQQTIEACKENPVRNLRDLRHAQNLTLSELAERSCLPISTIRYAEQHGSQPRFGTMIKIADGLGVPLKRLAE
jgi:predicted transcriptional regulator